MLPYRLIFCLLGAWLLTGCATSFYRFCPMTISGANYDESMTECHQRIYPATRFNVLTLRDCVSPNSGTAVNGRYYISGLQLPVHLLDLPFSLVFDTLCLPYDAIYNTDPGKHVQDYGWYRWWLYRVDDFIIQR